MKATLTGISGGEVRGEAKVGLLHVAEGGFERRDDAGPGKKFVTADAERASETASAHVGPKTTTR